MARNKNRMNGIENIKSKNIQTGVPEETEAVSETKDTLLKAKEAELQNLKKELESQERELKSKSLEMSKKEASLNKLEIELLEREANAEVGFLQEGKKVKVILEREKENLEKEVFKQREILAKIEVEVSKARAQKMEEISKEIQTMVEKEKKILDQNYEMEIKKLSDKENKLQQEISEMEKERENYISLQKSYEKKERELKYEFEFLEEEKLRLAETLERKFLDEKRKLDMETSIKDQKIEFYKDAIEEMKQQLKNYSDIELKSGGKSKEELVRELYNMERENHYLKEKISNFPAEMDWDRIEQLRKGKERAEKRLKILEEMYSDLKQQETRWVIANGEMQNLEMQKNVAERRLEAVLEQIRYYAEEVNALKQLHHKPQEIQARVGVIEEPYFKLNKSFMDSEITELEWLNMIYDRCQKSGFIFSKRLLLAFHTALKTSEWSPLTVLAGVSGTGKSELPNLYSKFGGLVYLPLPVQPDWDSPQSLFGFFNSVDNRFNATTLLRTLVQAQNDLNNNVILILLDEMNLAHVELYFSELLSKLEMRRSSSVELEIDLGAGLKKYPVSLEKNVLWIGTMNEDETTKTLSDKVIDRGNMITFPRPTEFVSRREILPMPESESLQRKTWDGWIKNKAEFQSEIEIYKEALEELNKNLEKVGRALGHRVWQSVENYMASHPLVIEAQFSENTEKYKKYLEKAYEDALVHKVMPKLRGIENTGKSRKTLDAIGELIRQHAPGLAEDFEYASSLPYGVFLWSSSKYLEADYEQ